MNLGILFMHFRPFCQEFIPMGGGFETGSPLLNMSLVVFQPQESFARWEMGIKIIYIQRLDG